MYLNFADIDIHYHIEPLETMYASHRNIKPEDSGSVIIANAARRMISAPTFYEHLTDRKPMRRDKFFHAYFYQRLRNGLFRI